MQLPSGLERLGQRVGALIETLLAVDGDPAELERDLEWAAAQVESVRERLEPHMARGAGVRMGLEGESSEARPYYVQGPMVGDHHPMALDMRIEHDGESTRGSVRFGRRFEGPPGCVHGGYVAHFFDQILGYHNLAEGHVGMTGSLQIKYRRPTRLDTELRFEARTLSASGGKVRIHGELLHGDDLVAEGEGLFVMPKRGFAEHVS